MGLNHMSLARIIGFTLVGLTFTACATDVTPEGSKVRLVTANQKETICQPIKIVTVQKKLGPDKAGSAMHKAMNEVASVGGNGIFMVSSNLDWAEGASVVAEALSCKF